MVDRTRITAAEYSQLPETNTPMELIDGELIVSPPPSDEHQEVVGNIYFFLRQTVPAGRVVISPMDIYLDDNTVLQPDVFWVSGTDSQCRKGEDRRWHGAPDLVIEVLSPSTARRDKATKFELHQKHGAREYWIVDIFLRLIEVYTLVNGNFERQGVYGDDETFTSVVLGGIVVPVGTLLQLT
jgi:Uma2 family endonuclease